MATVEKHKLKFTKGTNNVGVYLPTNFDKSKKYPVILFFHGDGQYATGTDSNFDEYLNHTNHKNLVSQADKYGIVVVAPHCYRHPFDGKHMTDSPEFLEGCINFVLSLSYVDISRFYPIGLSRGGGATLVLLTTKLEWTKKFAAAIPICGSWVNNPNWNLVKQFKTPIWGFHAINDTTVPINASRVQISNCGDSANLTELPTGGHSVWTSVFAREDIYQWLLSHQLEGFTPPIEEPNPDPEIPEIPEVPKELVDFQVKTSDGKLNATLKFKDGSVVVY